MILKDSVQIHPGKQLLYLFLLFIASIIVFAILFAIIIRCVYGEGARARIFHITATSGRDIINAYKLLLASNSLFTFLPPALFFSYRIMHEPAAYLKARSPFPKLLLALAAFIVLAYMPAILLLSHINHKLDLSGSLKGVDKWIRNREQAYKKMSIILNVKTTGNFISCLVVMGLLPALCEELFFRGCLQTIFKRWTNNTHAAIWITAFIFSFLHFEFFGFLPRLVMGGLLGYMVAWSGSIWPSVCAHFVNNSLAVIAGYGWHKTNHISDGQLPALPVIVYICSIGFTLLLLFLYKKGVSISYNTTTPDSYLMPPVGDGL